MPMERFLRFLKRSPREAVFNPWRQHDEENDIGPRAPGIRRAQLRGYLAERRGRARLALIGEALGYRGGHFTGIAMTSERILLEGIKGHRVLSTIEPHRTSLPEQWPRGFAEPTASIVWSALLELSLSVDEFVLWNAFPWHSFDRAKGILSNRTPTRAELAGGAPVLKALVDLSPKRAWWPWAGWLRRSSVRRRMCGIPPVLARQFFGGRSRRSSEPEQPDISLPTMAGRRNCQGRYLHFQRTV